MHRVIGYLSKRLIRMREGETRKVLLTFLYFFLVITAYYVVKPVSRSVVLSELGYRMVPYVDLICALVMGPVVTLFARLVDRLSKPRLVQFAFWTISGIMLLFWRLLAWPHGLVAGAFYIWISIFSVLVVTLFWLVANDLYRPREAKRLFGFIGSGGILGGIVGSSIAAAGAQLFGTQRLPLLSAGFLLVSWLVVRRLWRFSPERTTELPAASTQAPDTFLSNLRHLWQILRQSRYLWLLISIVALGRIVSALVYYQFNPFIERTFTTIDAKTTFTGIFFGSINVVAFIVQFFFTSLILRRLGLLWALLAMPVGLLFGSGMLLLAPIFWVAAGAELYDRALDYSINTSAKEVLYLPIDRSIRYKVKPFIDMVVFRFGKGLAAVIGIVLLDCLGVGPWWLSVIAVPLVILWIVAACKARGEYTMTIRTILQARAAARAASAQAAAPGAASGEPPLSSATVPLTSVSAPQRKLSLVTRLLEDHQHSAQARALVTELTRHEAAPSAAPHPERAYDVAGLKELLRDRSQDTVVRRQAIQLLARHIDQNTFDYLCGVMLVEEEATLRHEAVRALVTMRLTRREVRVPVEQVRRQVAREVDYYTRIAQIAAVYRQRRRDPVGADDPIIGLLRVLLEESVEQIFRLLMLLYRPEDINLIYEQMRVPEPHIRTDAIELLDNLVDPVMRGTIAPILDEDRFLSVVDQPGPGRQEEPAEDYRLLQDAIWDHDCWLSITALCAVGRLRATTMRQELERASQHRSPLVAAAAKLALHLGALG